MNEAILAAGPGAIGLAKKMIICYLKWPKIVYNILILNILGFYSARPRRGV